MNLNKADIDINIKEILHDVSMISINVPRPSSTGDYELVVSGIEDMAGNKFASKHTISYTPEVKDTIQPYIDKVVYIGDGIYDLHLRLLGIRLKNRIP